MADLYIPQSDKGFNIAITVQDCDGGAFDLTDYTVTLKVWRKGIIGTPIVDAACVIDVAASGTCHYVVTATDFVTAGDYWVEVEMTKSGVIESTRHYTLEVTESPS